MAKFVLFYRDWSAFTVQSPCKEFDYISEWDLPEAFRRYAEKFALDHPDVVDVQRRRAREEEDARNAEHEEAKLDGHPPPGLFAEQDLVEAVAFGAGWIWEPARRVIDSAQSSRRASTSRTNDTGGMPRLPATNYLVMVKGEGVAREALEALMDDLDIFALVRVGYMKLSDLSAARRATIPKKIRDLSCSDGNDADFPEPRHVQERAKEIIQDLEETRSDEVDRPADTTTEHSRLQIDSEQNTASLDGVTRALTPAQTRVLLRLQDAKGAWVSGEDLKQYPGLGERPDRVVKKLPGPLRNLVEAKRGTGFRLSFEHLDGSGQADGDLA